MSDEIVATMIGCTVVYEGKQYGNWLFAAGDPCEHGWLPRWKGLLAERMAIDLMVPFEHRDADWLARFVWIVHPMTREEWEERQVWRDDAFEDDDG